MDGHGRQSVAWCAAVEHSLLVQESVRQHRHQRRDVGRHEAKVDLTGKTLTAFVKIVSGLESGRRADVRAARRAALHQEQAPVTTTQASTYTNITAVDTWVPLSFELDNPSFVADAGALDLTDVREMGVQINSSGTTTTAAPAVVLIDTVSY